MKSLWSKTGGDAPAAKTFERDLATDVLVVGGGLSGMLAAYLLTQAGVDCLLVEAERVGSGVTQNTTAKITAQHSLIYADLINKFGQEKAALYYRANAAALGLFRELARAIPCDLEDKDAFVYGSGQQEKLEREARAYEQLGIPGGIQTDLPIPAPHDAAIRMDAQAQFHPLKFLYGLARQVPVLEGTFIEKVDCGKAYVRPTGGHPRGVIRARRIILCTHYPMVNIPGLYFMKINQERSYVVAVENGPNINGMYIGLDKDSFSFRNYGSYLLVGGGNHVTGRKGKGYKAPMDFARKTFPDKPLPFAWATQDCISLDRVPYVGRFHKGKDELYLATGFNKWGMTGTMAAAMVLRDLLTTGASEYEDLFLPTRSMLQPKLASNMLHSMLGMFGFRKRCPHMGCALRRNEEENSWDCPCHGSRFDATDGHVINNPSLKGIRPGK